MKCCKNCRWLKWVTTTDTFYYCSFDGGELSGDLSYCCNAWKPSAQTNADRIRTMSDEELAIWISALFTTQYNIKADPNFWADWLKEEVKE